MSSSNGLAFPDDKGDRFWALADQGPVALDLSELAEKVVNTLSRRRQGMSATQLSDELGVTPSAIIKSASELVEAGVLRKESLPAAKNVKLYVLATEVLDVQELKELKRKLPPTLLRIFTEELGGNENFAIAFTKRFTDYLKGVPEEDRAELVNRVLKEIAGHEKK